MGLLTSLSTGMPSTWRDIPPPSGFEDGINFFGEFNGDIANHAIATLHTALEQRGTPCYCLLGRKGGDRQEYFSRFGDMMVPSGLQLPISWSNISLDRLVRDTWHWPTLAIRVGKLDEHETGSYPNGLRTFLRRITWQAQIRLQNGDEYIGYFKLAGDEQSRVPDDRDLVAAAFITKLEVARLLAHRHAQSARTLDDFKTRLHQSAEEISSGAVGNSKAALRHVANMLTSHLGANWNRAAFYGMVDNDNTLQCLWAQGGDGNRQWCDKVQKPIGESIREIPELARYVHLQIAPHDDLYLAAVQTSPLSIGNVRDRCNENILAQLWRASGDVRAMPTKYQHYELDPVHTAYMSAIDRDLLSKGGPKAAIFFQDDAWVTQVVKDHPHSPYFACRNGQYFAFPWFSKHELIGIWILDMAYWNRMVGQPGSPSPILTAEVLTALGPSMDRHRRNKWRAAR